MDLIAREILKRELEADAEVIASAVQNAVEFLGLDSPGHLEACAYELHRGYTVLEHSMERICQACENQFEKLGDYHERLLERMELSLPGIRPHLLPPGARSRLREWKGFRHVVRHSYDLKFDSVRLQGVVAIAVGVRSEWIDWVTPFLENLPIDEP